ncbi:MAG TPA: NAD(P)-dependent oxidoreductase [Ramlibacter sp.]|nr:NAD(P)-dependent oxidoreductase [Ramlibacter sp.]
MTAMQLGWAGVGNMGAPMLQRLLDAGHAMRVCDARPQALEALRGAGATACDDVAELALSCDVIFLSLPSIDVAREVARSLLGPAQRRLRLIVNTGTTGATLSRELAAMAAPAGVRLVDCPVSGGPEAARAGALSIMASGRSEDIEALRPLLLLWGKAITVAGEAPGAAQTLKLVNNAIIVASYVSTLEAFLFGAKAGLAPQVMLDAINAGRLAPNGTTRVWLPDYILQGKPFGAQLHLLMKDMGLAMSEGQTQQVDMAVCQAALDVARRACAERLEESADLMDLMKALEADAQFTMARATTPAAS